MKKYLLVPALPTPNGGLHLGHMAAQFLRLDIFRRHVEAKGAKVAYLCGFDVFDNAVCVEAERRGVTPAEVAISFTSQMERELNHLDIQIDEVINYALPAVQEQTKAAYRTLEAIFGDRIHAIDTRYPFGNGAPIIGNWLQGKCPRCRQKIKGYTCDDCGISLLPAQLLEPENTKGLPMVWRDVSVKFVHYDRQPLVEYLSTLHIDDKFRSLALACLDRDELAAPWTNYDSWGLVIDGFEVYFRNNIVLAETLILGELSKRFLDTSTHAFDKDSAVTTVIAYGKDNVGVFLIDQPGMALSTGKYKFYDAQWISHFYNLEGRKMSTNQRYAIWMKDVMEAGLSSDSVRLYLTGKFDNHLDANLSMDELLAAEERYVTMRTLVEHRLDELGTPLGSEHDTTRLHDVERSWQLRCEEALDVASPDIKIFDEALTDWMGYESGLVGRAESLAWSSGFARLFHPVMPRLAERIANRLGLAWPPTSRTGVD